MALSATIRCKVGTTEQWETVNRVLKLGELGVEINDKLYNNRLEYLLKVGDGVTPWNKLQYCNGYEKLIETLKDYDDLVKKPATIYKDGLMSKEDKRKLDQLIIFEVDDNLDASSKNPISNELLNRVINDIHENINTVYNELKNHENNSSIHFDPDGDIKNNKITKTFTINMLKTLSDTTSNDRYKIVRVLSELSEDENQKLTYKGKKVEPDLSPYYTSDQIDKSFISSISYNKDTNQIVSKNKKNTVVDTLNLSSVVVSNNTPKNTNTLWIDTGHSNCLKFYNPTTASWEFVPSVWG